MSPIKSAGTALDVAAAASALARLLVAGTKAPPISAEAASNELPFSNTSRRLTRLFESSCWSGFQISGIVTHGPLPQ